MGVSSDNGNNDFEVAIMGGSTFEERIAELAGARKSLMDAYTDLGLGKTAQVAVAAAKDAQAKAEKALADGKATADAMTAKANAEALSVVHSAKVKMDAERRAANEQIEAQKADAAAMRASAKAAADEAAKALADAKKAEAEMENAKHLLVAATAEQNASARIHAAEAEKLKALRLKVTSALRLFQE